MSYARYHLIQVVRDHSAPQPETVGLLVDDGSQVELRIIGSGLPDPWGPGDFQAGFIRYALPDLAGQEWIFENWILWFQQVTAAFGENPAKNLRLLERLERRGESVIASAQGEILVAEGESLAEIADRLFSDWVLQRPAIRRARFLGAVHDLLLISEAATIKGFMEDMEVVLPADSGQSEQFIHFPYFWESGRHGRFALKLVSFAAEPREVSAAVAEAANTFDLAIQKSVLSARNCLLLHDSPPADLAHYLDHLGRRSSLINIDDRRQAAAQLRNLFLRS